MRRSTLPPGVPYERQQYHALMAENGTLPPDSTVAEEIRARLL
ncbi:hypothetical protein [Actinoplanes sp. NBRC 103695]|nr:hypothetical protein [Actinoplanes sp. NBRC 103695]